ncbi:MAG: AraC family transcriptional regulator [Rubritepida sp.]|nr:AraC family transcriptional regulator [Rubritepida sp.]
MSNSPRPVAVVTGASSGIGAVYADRLAARGYDLLLVARRADRLEALSARLAEAHGGSVAVLAADLTKEDDLARVEQALAGNPAISLLVNNAGNAKLAPLAQTSVAEASTMIALNITSLMRLTQSVLPGFVARNAGTIINIGSVLSLHALPTSGVYSGTKGFVLNFSRSLQAELAGTGVKVQLVLPAATATELWDLAGVPLAGLKPATVMSAEDMVDAALAGLDQGEAITIPPVEDIALWAAYDAARAALFAATRTGKPASRYTG